MINPFNITDEQLNTLMVNYLKWHENYERKEDYIDYMHRIETYINEFLINEDFLTNANEEDFFSKVYDYPRMLEGPVQMRLGETRMRNNLSLIKRNLKYIMDSEDDPIDKCDKVLNGSYKIDVFAKSFWTPILSAKHPTILPYWNNKTENFFKKTGINIRTKKKAFKEKCRNLSEAFKYLNALNPKMDFHHINHLTHYGTAVEEGIKLIESFYTNLDNVINENEVTNENEVKYWFVCQGKTFTHDRGHKYLWAPQKSKDGRTLYHWENMKRVQKNDIIVNYANGKVQGYSIALNNYHNAINPLEQNNWENEGYKVEIDFNPYDHPFSIKKQTWKFSNLLKGLQGPFDKDGNVKQGYLFEFSNEAYNILQKLINDQGDIMETSALTFSLNSFSSDVADSGLHFDDGLISRFISSLLSKPFVILTGLSGSGKTKLAQAFVQWISAKDEKSDDGLTFSLKVNKSAIEHQGWTLPIDTRKEFVDWNQKKVKIEVDGESYDAHLDNTLRLFYDKKLELNNKYKIGEKVNVTIMDFSEVINENVKYILLPVGADWTNREPLLGYPNALETGKYVKPENGVLGLILNAIESPEKPFFLILDEMNLSHVERYFADFLSAMESGEAIPLHPDSDEWKDENGNWKDGVPDKIKLPPNLFIIGTVNIDETTYMFSPKVLDRANVIEFRVTEGELVEFLKNPAKPDLDSIEGKGAGMAVDFVKLAKEKPADFDESEILNKILLEFFDELKKTGAEFGYRTASEIHSFCSKLHMLTKDEEITFTADEMIDAAVLQKLLPKLHGSRKKLEPVLNSLAILCLTDEHKNELLKLKKGKNPNIGAELDKIVYDENENIDNDTIRFKLSMEKILRMKKRVIQDGFTSFAEA